MADSDFSMGQNPQAVNADDFSMKKSQPQVNASDFTMNKPAPQVNANDFSMQSQASPAVAGIPEIAHVQAKPRSLIDQAGSAIANWWNGQAAESAQTREKAKQVTDPFLAEKALLAPVATPVEGLMQYLQRPGDITQSLLAGNPGMAGKALTQGLTPAEHANNQKGLLGGAVEAGIEKLPGGWPQTAARIAEDVATDPLTYAGGLGFGEKLYKAGAENALPAVLNASDKASNVVQNVARKVGGETGAGTALNTLGDLGHVASDAYRFSVPGGDMKLGLAKDFGSQGNSLSNRMFSAKNFGKAKMNAMQGAFSRELQGAVSSLSPEDEGAVYNALHTGTVQTLPPNLAPVAARLKNLTDSQAYLSGTQNLRDMLVSNGFTLPEYAQPFDSGVRGLMDVDQYRKYYVPTAQDGRFVPQGSDELTALTDMSQGQAAKPLDFQAEKQAPQAGVDLTNDTDLNLQRRQEQGMLAEDPLEQRRIFENRLFGGARAMAGRDAGERATFLYNQANPTRTLDLGPGNQQQIASSAKSFDDLPGYVKDFFVDKYTPQAEKTGGQKAADAFKGSIDLPKGEMFALPFRHMANIATLGLLANPSPKGMLDLANNFRQIATASHEQKYNLMRDAIDAGAVGMPAADKMTNTVDGLAKSLANTPVISQAVNGVRKLYTMSGNLLWSFDDASKVTRFRQLVAEGAHPADAAAQTNAELIDYANKSGFTNAVSYLAPFATYRTKLPGAVARSVAQHPERALTINRISPTLAGGNQDAGTDDQGNQRVSNSNLPLAEIMHATQGPKFFGVIPEDYTRSTLGYPGHLIGSGLQIGDSDNATNYMTYGQALDTPKSQTGFLADALVGGIPGASQVLSKIGLSQFPDKGLPGFISGQTGVTVKKKPISEAAVQASQDESVQKGFRKPTRAETLRYLNRHPGKVQDGQ